MVMVEKWCAWKDNLLRLYFNSIFLWLANWLVYFRYLAMRRDGKAGLIKMLQRKKLSLMDIMTHWTPATNFYLLGKNRYCQSWKHHSLHHQIIDLPQWVYFSMSLCPYFSSSYYKKCICFQITVFDGNSLVP